MRLLVRDWMSSHKIKSLGVPRFIATGQHEHDGAQSRFLVMERFGSDLQKLFDQAGKRFPASTVFLLGLKLVRSSDTCFLMLLEPVSFVITRRRILSRFRSFKHKYDSNFVKH